MSRSPLRVGMVCPYSFDTFGGVQHHVQGLAGALRRLGHRVDVLAPGDQDRERDQHVTVVGEGPALPFNGSVAPVRIGARRQVAAWLAAGRYDVVHVHEPAAPSTAFTAVRALLDTEVPVVATHHIAQERALTLRMAAPTVLRGVLPRVDAHIVVSEEARRTLLRYHRVDAVPVPNGVDARVLGPGDRAVTLEERRDLLFVGRPDEPRKGFETLLGALPTVLEKHPDLRLVVVGGDRLPRDLPRELARRLERLRGRIELTGRLSESEKVRRFAAARVLVAPNTGGESFGIVLAEGLAAGVPVVASDLTAFRAVLGDGELGVLVPPEDPVRLAEGVLGLLADPARSQRMVDAGRVAAHSTFDWSAIAPRVLQVYGEAAARRGHRGPDPLGWSEAPSGT
jgi:phosphatidyl-myo-inositol alpha-mannosyltransferase